MTGLIHASRLHGRFATNFFTTDQFLEDAARGELPTYSFIEPNFVHGHNDMHPAFNALAPGMSFDPPSSLLGGEALLAKIYNAIRSSSANGSNYLNTLLMINFDEHGGTYDHVSPPAAPPPDPAAPAGQMGFTFNRSGVRVPAIAISPWIPERTVVNDEYRHTSVIRTLRERWSLGAPLTARDAIAADIAPIFSLSDPRGPEDWPDVVPLAVPTFDLALLPPDDPLSPLPRAIFFACLELGKALGKPGPDFTPDANIKGAEAVATIREMFVQVFPGLRSQKA
jgi:phospholipase C